MALIVTKFQFASLLETWADSLEAMTIRLFSNDYTPTPDDDVTDFTQAIFSGYQPVALGVWNAAFLNAADRGEITHPTVTWAVGAGGVPDNVYGYYITDSGNNLLLAERNPAGLVVMDTVGQTFLVLPRITLRNDPSP